VMGGGGGEAIKPGESPRRAARNEREKQNRDERS
jgi:hypothetical protein